jgi:hypothetical protein
MKFGDDTKSRAGRSDEWNDFLFCFVMELKIKLVLILGYGLEELFYSHKLSVPHCCPY